MIKARAGKIVSCTYCDKKFYRQANEIARNNIKGVFCSTKCYGKWRSEHIKGDACSWWRGGENWYYLSSWTKSRQAAKNRDNFTCQACGKQSPPKSRLLDVHHIISQKQFDNPNDAHRLDNLVTLCRVCHNKLRYNKLQLLPRESTK